MLEARQHAVEPPGHRLLVQGRAVAERDHRHRHFAPFLVRTADHRGVLHLVHVVQHLLHFRRVDVLAARNNHVLEAVVDPVIAVFVPIAHVAGMVPAVPDGLPGRFLVAPIFVEDALALDENFAGLPGRHVGAVVADDPRFAVKGRLADGPRLAVAVGGQLVDGAGRRFGGAV